jgi:hypothetical protein
VQVQATEQPVAAAVHADAEQYERLAYSNIPALLLVVDVKRNRLFYSWISPESLQKKAYPAVFQFQLRD